ncbi:MAG TPA: sigma-70 family RNA polymerase sigma factor [Bacteroidetes bacterium]|nr:sigma-70 family RNA polymerase sigma factor [Bacteroidota bacterium]
MAPETVIPSEEELIRKSKRGDRQAFGRLVERYQDQVYTLACRTLGDVHLAEDISQEAFIRAWRAVARFEEKAKFSSWLYRITLNACFSELRRRNKPVDQVTQEELGYLKILNVQTVAADTTIERRDLVEKLIAGLPPVYRSIVVLFYLQELNCNEISSVLGRPVGTVKAYLHRARAQLRKNAEHLLKTRSLSK